MNNYRRRLEPHTLEVLQTPSVGEVCEHPKVSSLLNSFLVLELVYVLASCSIKKREKNERSYHGDNAQLSINKNTVVSTLKCPAFGIKQSPIGRSPKDHQVRAHAYLSLNKVQSCFFFSILVFSGLNV